MSFSAAASGFAVLFLSVTVGQAKPSWSVKYGSSQICALKGSTVKIKCTFTYPSERGRKTTNVETSFWFTKVNYQGPLDLKKDSDYNGRITYEFTKKNCILTIRDLKQSDSAKYKFRFTTNQPTGSYTGLPGVTLTVADFRVQVRRLETLTELKCESSCDLNEPPSYVWYKKEQKMEEKSPSIQVSVRDDNSYSCSVKGHKDYRSPSVYAPKLLIASLMSSDEITEGSSVTLSCSSEANPAAKYTWKKKKNNQTVLSQAPQFVLSSILSSDSGQYYCTAKNELGERTSGSVSVDVKYAPRPPSVTVTPSGEIMEGSSVTLTCSSDANPAANYTWYKEGEESPKASVLNFTITNIMVQDGGNYSCEAQNSRGNSNATITVTVVAAPWNQVTAAAVPVAFLAFILICLFLWIIRKKKGWKQQSGPGAGQIPREQVKPAEENVIYANVHLTKEHKDPLYANVSPAQSKRHLKNRKAEEMVEYASVNFDSTKAGARAESKKQDAAEDPAALYSTVNKPRKNGTS
ncbi:sialoadhesin-like [Anableps anableps]